MDVILLIFLYFFFYHACYIHLPVVYIHTHVHIILGKYLFQSLRFADVNSGLFLEFTFFKAGSCK